MPNLRDTLRKTVFFQAQVQPSEIDSTQTLLVREDHWSYAQKGAKPSVVTNLECFSKLTNTHNRVLDTLEWLPPTIATTFGEFDLPLTDKFILKKYHLGRTGLATSHQLPNMIESGFFTVFGYQYDAQKQTFVPIDPDSLDDDEFVPAPDEKPAKFAKVRVATGKKIQIQLRPFRVLFCLELLCCEPKGNYEPTGAGIIARFFPRSYLLSTGFVKIVAAETRFTRPTKVNQAKKPSKAGHDHHKAGDTMSAGYHCGYYTDTNNESPASDRTIPPKWDTFFSYYAHNDSRRFHVVKAHEAKSRTRKRILKLYRQSTKRYVPGDVTKLPRQGAFDNVHIAPAMIAPAAIRKARQKGLHAERWKSLSLVEMAPICQHDCFHMHWRWSEGFGGAAPFGVRHTRGWGEEGGYMVAGAPMIPHNQNLYVESPRPHQLHYLVTTNEVAPKGRWQIILDHGAGYMVDLKFSLKIGCLDTLAVNNMILRTRQETADVEPELNAQSDAMLYWNLRFVIDKGEPKERVLFDRPTLEALIAL